MRPTDASNIAQRVGGRLAGDGSASVLRVVTDTRGVIRPGDLYVGLRGPRFDGAVYAQAALDAGASAVLVSRTSGLVIGSAQAAIEVEDALTGLQRLAAVERAHFKGAVVAITGSNGKSTTKEMLHLALATARRVWSSPMSYNSQVGVALSLLDVDLEADVVLVECGISLPGEMQRLATMVHPTHGVLVNVSDAHLEGLGSRERTASEKAKLFAHLPPDSCCLVPAEEVLAIEALSRIGAPVREVQVRLPSWAEGWAPALAIDASLAVEGAVLLGASREGAEAALSKWEPSPMRMETAVTPRGVTVINDAWTADPASMETALVVLSRAAGRRVAVLGGMSQLGEAQHRAHTQVGRRVAELGVDVLIGVGSGGAEIASAAVGAGMSPEDVAVVDDVRAAASAIEEHVEAGDTVLLKASRPMGLERVAPLLVGSVEPARAHIDLDTLVENLRTLERAAGEGVAVMPVIKAFGYGLDATRIARTLERAGAEYFCVAYAEEGVTLREAGITAPILVQNVVPDDVYKLVGAGLTAEIGGSGQLDLVAREAERARRPTRVHLKVDTGMGRAGVQPDDALELAMRARRSTWVELEGLMTHFAASDAPEHDAFTRRQIVAFDGVRKRLAAEGIAPRWIHACNSAAIGRFPEAHYSMVRAGIGLFGYEMVEGHRVLGTRPVLRLLTRVVAVKEVSEGGYVGYGLTWQATQSTRVAIVALGYGDGYPRALSGRGWMSVAGVRCPVIGRVCMDVSMLDVSAVSGEVRAGDEVVVYGAEPNEPDLCEMATQADTIPYELLTRISGRVRRIFVGSREL